MRGFNLKQFNDHANLAQKGMRTALISIVVNLVLATVKILTGIAGNAYALVADGIESLMDIFTSTVVWGGLKIGAKPPDHNHPFGHGRAEPLSAMIVSGVVLAVAVGIAIQSVREISQPHSAPASFTLYVLIGVVIIKEAMSRVLFRVGKDIDSLSVKADAWHSRSDALTSLAAFIGISISLWAGKGYEAADDWAALFASGVILYNGINLLRTSISDIMDEAVRPELQAQIKRVAKKVPGVAEIEMCRARKSGFGFFVEMHIKVEGGISVREGHDIAHQVKEALFNSKLRILDVSTHIEPVE